MSFIDWLIVIIPLAAIFYAAFYSRRYIHDVVDFLAAGRVAGRYTISVGDLASCLSVITLVSLAEQNYQCGFGVSFWGAISIPVGIAMGLTGFCAYRWRQTQCLSKGQFIELRYGSKVFRLATALIATTSEAVTNAIGPAIATKFFIYYLGLPHRIMIFGVSLPCYGIIVAMCLTLAILLIWPSGRVSLLLTDCFQGLLTYPIFLIFAGFILLKFGWNVDVLPVLVNRAPEQSFVDPHHVSAFRDFNIFMIAANLFAVVMNRASWYGNDCTNSGRTPHEQKMAGILGSWRNGFSYMVMVLIALIVYVFMTSGNFATPQNRFGFSNNELRRELTAKVMDELAGDGTLSADQKTAVEARIAALPDIANDSVRPIAQIPNDTYQNGAIRHQEIKVRKSDGTVVESDPGDGSVVVCENLDKRYFDAVYGELGGTPEGREAFQQYRSKFQQMMMPMILRKIFPTGLLGLFCLLAIMLLISTDDSRIFNAVGCVVQDLILPFYKERLSSERHIRLLRIWCILIGIFFFVVSMFFSQMDYIVMFTTITNAIWMGAAGPIMIGGLYTSFGNLTGAWCSLIFGSGTALLGMLCQFQWAKMIYPWLERHQMVDSVGAVFAWCCKPFRPYIQWDMNAVRFPINSYEILFIAILLAIIGYVVGSLVTYKPFNLDKLLHRGKYAETPEKPAEAASDTAIPAWPARTWNFIQRSMVGIDSEYTIGDKCVAYSVFLYVIIYQFLIQFVGAYYYTKYINVWSEAGWGTYFLWVQIIIPSIIGVITSIWFIWGTLTDIGQLYRDLAVRKRDDNDTGQIMAEPQKR